MMEYFGNPAHFNGGANCIFHLTTIVDNKFLVSTIGEWKREYSGGSNLPKDWFPLGFDDKGNPLYYETLVVSEWDFCPCGCGNPVVSANLNYNLNQELYGTAKEATEGHLKMCKKYEMIE